VSLQSRFAEIVRTGGRAALVTVLKGPAAGSKLLVEDDGTIDGGLGDDRLEVRAVELANESMWAERSLRVEEGDAILFADAAFPQPRLVIFGAIDFSVSLSRLARASGWRPYVIDPRGTFAREDRFPDAERVIVAWPEPAFAEIGGLDRATALTVLTHDPKLDDAALIQGLASDAFYLGAMGSRQATDDRQARLLAAGVSEQELARISAPIGLDLGASTPEGTALSILAEIVAVRNGRGGGRLSRSRLPIHETAGG
jgi:xanthine dehydrogenase accessory factor